MWHKREEPHTVEALSIDAFSSRPIMASKVSALEHELEHR
jgi:hypothetical protein